MSDAHVVVGWDGSPASDDAVRLAVRLAARRGAPLEVVLVWDLLTQPGEFRSGFDQRAAEEAVAAAAARLTAGTDARDVRTKAVLGQAAGALLEAAAGAGVLVVGRSGAGEVVARLVGSVTETLLRHAPCPVVVVPHRGQAGSAEGGPS